MVDVNTSGTMDLSAVVGEIMPLITEFITLFLVLDLIKAFLSLMR